MKHLLATLLLLMATAASADPRWSRICDNYSRPDQLQTCSYIPQCQVVKAKGTCVGTDAYSAGYCRFSRTEDACFEAAANCAWKPAALKCVPKFNY